MNFYERRARRILPALSLVIAVTTALALSGLMLPDQLTRYFQSVIATALFAANFFFWWTTDYFAPAAEESPLLHMWSLAVEEQFYLVFPIFLYLVWHFRKSWLGPLMALGALASLALAQYASQVYPTPNFYFPVTRVWELLAGSLVAMTLRGAEPARSGLGRALSLLGLGLVLVSIFLIDESFPYPSLWTAIPVVGTALMIRYTRPDDPGGWLLALALAPMVFIGQLSYSIYLWHQPLLAFARISTFGPVDLWVKLALAALCVPLSWLSWRFVEQPFRKGYSRGTIFKLSGVSLAAMVAMGAVLGFSPNLAYQVSRLDESDRPAYARVQDLSEVGLRMITPYKLANVGDGCVFREDKITPVLEAKISACAERHGPGVMVTGGSHGIDLFLMLAENSSAPFLVGISRGNCRAHAVVHGHYAPGCFFPELPDVVARHADELELFVYTQAAHSMFDAGRRVQGTDGFHPEAAKELAAYLEGISASVPVLALGPQGMLGDDVRSLAPDHDFAAQLTESYDPGIAEAEALAEKTMAAEMEVAVVPFPLQAGADGRGPAA